MLAEIAVIPSAPLLVPELAGPGAAETAPVRVAVLAAGSALAAVSRRWVAVGAGDRPGCAADCAGTGDFGGYGPAVPVDLRHPGPREISPPLSMLIAGWLGGQVTPRPETIVPLVTDPVAASADCRAIGRAAVTDPALLGGADPVGLLVVADGPNALSPSAPGGGERDSAWSLARRLTAAVAAADGPALAGLSESECAAEGVVTRVAWQVLAGVLDAVPAVARLGYSAAPFGVGYTVATMVPEHG